MRCQGCRAPLPPLLFDPSLTVSLGACAYCGGGTVVSQPPLGTVRNTPPPGKKSDRGRGNRLDAEAQWASQISQNCKTFCVLRAQRGGASG